MIAKFGQYGTAAKRRKIENEMPHILATRSVDSNPLLLCLSMVGGRF
jgi:hypothetical protein